MHPWIKIETILPDKPEVIRMAAALRSDQDCVVGKLVRLWSWADANTVDGVKVPVTKAFIDQHTRKRGFAAAMESVGWLTGKDGELNFPGFERHNGASSKARAETARRVAKHRVSNAKAVTDVTPKALPKAAKPAATKGEPVDTLAWAEKIQAAYGNGKRMDGRMQVLQDIRADLDHGQDPAEMLGKVRECSAHIEKSCGWESTFAPFALKFFGDRQWQAPDMFRDRGMKRATGTNGNAPTTRRAAFTTAAATAGLLPDQITGPALPTLGTTSPTT
jgi:hypothetical protein